MLVFVIMPIGQVNIEFDPGNSRLLLARNMEVIAIEPQFFQLVLELMRIHAKVHQRAKKHVAADAAEDIEIKNSHKFQIPSSKLQRNANIQPPNSRTHVGACCLEFLWSLEVDA